MRSHSMTPLLQKKSPFTLYILLLTNPGYWTKISADLYDTDSDKTNKFILSVDTLEIFLYLQVYYAALLFKESF